jgi:heptaprenyl diphosphate synthase
MPWRATGRRIRMNVKRITLLAMYLTMALIIFTLEAQIPPIVPFPGVKLGLANVIILVVIMTYGKRDAFTVLILRIIMASIFSGQIVGFMYSLCGGIVSFAVMSMAACFIKRDKLWVISVLGAVAHNIGQIAVAIFITGTWQIAGYFSILFVSAIITGFFTGISAQLILKRAELAGVMKGKEYEA